MTDAREEHVATPFGPPAAPVTVGRLGGRAVAFLPRHGRDHQYVAHRVPYRANMWALHEIGVRAVMAPCSVGSLQPHIHPGQMVVVDQLVDRTHGRADTYHDVGSTNGEPGTEPPVHHQSFADPYDPALRSALVGAARSLGIEVHDNGTMVVINGPRFSTRAESRWFSQMGWHVVNMTGYPEAVLAAELGIRYASVALVTDYDAGTDSRSAVTMDEVFAVMRANVARVRELILTSLADEVWDQIR
jgi:5'-methylthioadenosine phosphorylase